MREPRALFGPSWPAVMWWPVLVDLMRPATRLQPQSATPPPILIAEGQRALHVGAEPNNNKQQPEVSINRAQGLHIHLK